MANEIVKQDTAALSNSEKFTAKVLREFGQVSPGDFRVSDYQRQLIQGYFIQIDRALKAAEENRVYKNENNKDHKYDNPDPVSWQTVDLNALALDVMHYARMGLDMTQKNMLFAIPYKDNSRKAATGSKMYTVNLMTGYNGVQYISEMYAIEKPKTVTVELVYSTDTFKPVKKNRENTVESYDFEINNAFDRGEVIGGFGYIEFADPTKNKLIMMSRKDIEKRKPKYASAEFWGGKKKEWQGGKQVEVESDGWYEEMCIKTIKREVYSPKNIPIDPKKIDDSYQFMRQQELRLAQMQAQDVIEANTATEVIDIPDTVPEALPGAEAPVPSAPPASLAGPAASGQASPANPDPVQDNDGQMFIPGF